MDVIALPSQAGGENPFRRDIGRLIETVGTASFELELFRAAAEAIRCEHLSAFAMSAMHSPRMLFAANPGTSPIARSAGRTYVGKFWNADPTNRLLCGMPELASGVLVSVSSEELQGLRYRRACYSRADWESSGINLIHKVSLIKNRGGDMLKVNFYRHRDAGPFNESDRRKIIESSGVLFALLARHSALDARDDLDTLRRKFEKGLAGAGLGVTPREIQVCAGIAVGMSSEAIALTLNVGLNTILTHRKRAYARLGISSQNELMRFLYGQIATAPLLQ